jgi:DNA-binding FadR family transcriptional regulator
LFRRPKLSDVLYADILEQIRNGQFAVGTKLPSENELSHGFGISRPVVREALRRLRMNGLVHSHKGAGTFVLKLAAPELGVDVNAPSPMIRSIADVCRMYDFRFALEGEIAYAAALNRSDALVEVIKGKLDAIDLAVRTGHIGVQQDADFHASIARATQNQFFEAGLASVQSHLNFVIDLSRTFLALHSAEHMARVQREHTAIYEAIRGGDGPAARLAMQTHVRNAQERLFEGDGSRARIHVRYGTSAPLHQ